VSLLLKEVLDFACCPEVNSNNVKVLQVRYESTLRAEI
jgi:hypothetical protein